MEYNERLRALREDNDKTQQEIAEIIGTSQSYYAKYENGRHPLPIQHLKTLCDYYQVSADYILGLPNDLNWPRKRKLPKEPRISDIQRANAQRQRQIRMEQLQMQKLEIDLD